MERQPQPPRRRRTTRLLGAGSALAAALALAGCGQDDGDPAAGAAGGPGTAGGTAEGTVEEAYAPAVSDPVEDSVYPDRGDDRIDTLHHDLELGWDPDERELTGRQTVTFRGAEDAEEFVLDLSAALAPTDVRLDGQPVEVRHEGDVLTVEHAVEEDRQYALSLRYSGPADPAEAPMERADMTRLGVETTAQGWVHTMQEPFGAFTWYAVNDQPADKALYDVRLRVPSPWVGVSNGELVSRVEERTEGDALTVTEFHLAEPASSYLMTLAFGPYEMTRDPAGEVGEAGTPITYWTSRDDTDYLVDRLAVAPDALTWLEERLGPYPFDTLGFVVVPGSSAMETQTLITMGSDDSATSPETVVHEIAHHWWGDQVGPCDWRDLWMNEGMATYLQTLWTDEQAGVPEGTTLEQWSRSNDLERADYGPPGDYRPDAFASSNVYVPPATMWHELRSQIGDEQFWELAAGWPASQDNSCSDREELVEWWSDRTGEDLSGFFEDWLMGETDPE